MGRAPARRIRNPKVLGRGVVDANGEASLNILIPGAIAGQTVILQALALSTCTFSNSLAFMFP